MKCPNTEQGHKVNNTATLFTESIAKVSKNQLSNDPPNAKFYLFRFGEKADKSVTEKESIYVLHLCDRTLTVKYLNIKHVKTTNVTGFQASIEQAFKRLGISTLTD